MFDLYDTMGLISLLDIAAVRLTVLVAGRAGGGAITLLRDSSTTFARYVFFKKMLYSYIR